jgi:hypothetical protein
MTWQAAGRAHPGAGIVAWHRLLAVARVVRSAVGLLLYGAGGLLLIVEAWLTLAAVSLVLLLLPYLAIAGPFEGDVDHGNPWFWLARFVVALDALAVVAGTVYLHVVHGRVKLWLVWLIVLIGFVPSFIATLVAIVAFDPSVLGILALRDV